MTDRLHYLLQAYADKNYSAEEMQELNALLEDDWNRLELGRQAPHIDWEKMYRQIMPAPVMVTRSSNKKWYRLAAAAAVLMVMGTIAYFTYFNTSTAPVEIVKTPVEIPAPVISRATITLADGQQIFLDSAANGTLATQGNADIVKLAGGQIAYNASTAVDNAPHNLLSNPRGSNIISITLSDGTKVWLNSESSLKYPATFSGNERKVEVTGEAYFEVAKQKKKTPFIVAVNTISGEHKADVEVLGTHFNINAYHDEELIKTTLLEGSVKVTAYKTNDSKMLQPGQQAALNFNQQLQLVNNLNTDQVTAWTNGFFQFTDLDIKTILRQLSRWYNVDVAFESHPSARRFGGRISNQLNLSEVLRLLEANGIHSRVEGRTIIVLP